MRSMANSRKAPWSSVVLDAKPEHGDGIHGQGNRLHGSSLLAGIVAVV